MLIDTHCHLDAPEFTIDRADVITRARAAQVKSIVIPAVAQENFATVCQLAHSEQNFYYALGIHPMWVAKSSQKDLDVLAKCLADNYSDDRLVALGEIGLDFYLPDLKTPESIALQEHFYTNQLDLAEQYNLPVLLHVRKSQDILLKHLRKRKTIGGIAHAFNGSLQQAEQFLNLGFKLGVGGAMTYSRAKQIRRLIISLPLDAFVLETDAPDIPPEWLVANLSKNKARNEPAEIAKIAEVMAGLLGIDVKTLIAQTAKNTLQVLPKIKIM